MRITTKTEISAYPLLSRGKVRDIYDIDDKTLLIVTTDRMSAFDVIMDKPIPYKGVILNQITLFWMDKFKDIIPNHLVESDVDRFPACGMYRTRLHLRLGLERLSEDRHALRLSAACRHAGIRQAGDGPFHAFHQGRAGPA